MLLFFLFRKMIYFIIIILKRYKQRFKNPLLKNYNKYMKLQLIISVQ